MDASELAKSKMSDQVKLVGVILALSGYLLWRASTVHRRMTSSTNPRKNIFQTVFLTAAIALASMSICRLTLGLTWTEVFISAGLVTIAVVALGFLYGRFR